MDENVLKELAEIEVELDGYEWRPKWKSLFYYSIADKLTDLSEAIEYYKSLTDEQIEERYCIHYWENAAWGCYDILRHESQKVFRKSISPQDLAKREIKNVELLLHEGKYQLILIKDNEFHKDDIPSLYEKLLTGTWSSFIDPGEVGAYETAYDASRQEFFYNLKKMFDCHGGLSDDEPISKELLDEFMRHKSEFQKRAPRYIHYFNKDWVVAMQIQALLWFKEFQKRVQQEGIFSFGGGALDWVAPKGKLEQKIVPMELIRNNDGYSAMTSSFNSFMSENGRIPKWSELMDYMAKKPPNGFVIEATYKGKNVSELLIEGVNNPIDRDAFRQRYNRYFKKKTGQSELNYRNNSEDIVFTKVYF